MEIFYYLCLRFKNKNDFKNPWLYRQLDSTFLVGVPCWNNRVLRKFTSRVGFEFEFSRLTYRVGPNPCHAVFATACISLPHCPKEMVARGWSISSRNCFAGIFHSHSFHYKIFHVIRFCMVVDFHQKFPFFRKLFKCYKVFLLL